MPGVMHEPFVTSNHLLDDAAALRRRIAEDGHLFFRGLGPKDKILAARRDVLGLCAEAGWCDSHGKWTGAGPFTEGDREYMAVYKNVIKLPTFLAVPEDAALMSLMDKIVAGPAMLHRLRIGRITFPNNATQTTAAHQDHWYIRGSEATYTIWMPLGDCPIDLGGLALLPASHKAGFIEHCFHAEKKYAGHGLADDQLPAETREWVAGDFELGDFLVFHSLTIHKALPNLTRDRLRISTDNRYQREGDSIAELSTRTHYNL
jgi:ectoine hydroxylase-related dioxygenase (phytanoyl-CoA dioxygenase family)